MAALVALQEFAQSSPLSECGIGSIDIPVIAHDNGTILQDVVALQHLKYFNGRPIQIAIDIYDSCRSFGELQL
jgi:hypothetical protein